MPGRRAQEYALAKMTQSRFDLVVPAFNEAINLEALVRRFVECAESLQYKPGQTRLVIVNNGSTDTTADVLLAMGQGAWAPWIVPVHLSENQGYGGGILAGLKATRAPMIGFTHADMQCDLNDALTACEMLHKKCRPTLIKGKRRGRALKDHFASSAYALMAKALLKLEPTEIGAQPKVFPRELLASLQEAPEGFVFDLFVLAQAQRQGFAFAELPVKFLPRQHGASNWAHSLTSRYKTMAHAFMYMLQLRDHLGRP